MARYYFDVTDDAQLVRDEFGVDLGSFEEAREQAQSLLPDIVRYELPNGEQQDFVCEVRNEANRIVYRTKLLLRSERVDEPAAKRDGADGLTP